MPVVVSDASVLICLGALQQLHLLRDFYQEVFVPDAVWREVTGTVGVLLRAKQGGAISALKPLLDTLITQHHFRLSRPLYNRVLQQVGEMP